jgi:hypothetical protein
MGPPFIDQVIWYWCCAAARETLIGWGAVSCGGSPKLAPRWQDFNPPRGEMGYDNPKSVQTGGEGPGLG